MKIARITTVASSVSLWLTLAASTFAQEATESAPKGGTNGALPSAGSTELTYIIFVGGVLLFVFATMKFILSFRTD